MDWSESLEKKFGDDKEVKNLKEEKFYGYIQVNFRAGEIISLNKHQTIE